MAEPLADGPEWVNSYGTEAVVPVGFCIDWYCRPAIAGGMIMLFRRTAALFLLLAGSLSAAGSAQQRLPVPQPVEQEAAPPALKPALWKIADADTTIYLFGTVHALPGGMDWLGGPLAAALDGSDELVTEIPEVDPVAMQSNVMARAVLPPNQTLRELLSKHERKQFEAAVAANGLHVSAFDRFEPWYAAVGLATLPLLRDGYAAENGVEGVLTARMKALKKPHTGLETLDYQLSLFDSLPPRTQRRYLMEVIRSMPTLRQELDEIVNEWGQGHAAKLAELMNAEQDDPAMIAALLTNRNRAWAGWMKARMDRPGTVFVAVGAGHLAGKNSVQDFLIRHGLPATRVQ